MVDLLRGNPPKLDEYAVNGLNGVTNSLAYKVHEIEKHFHNDEQVYGNLNNDMTADTPIKFTVIGGNDAYGTELMLTDGTVVESGSSTKQFDFDTLYVLSVSAANKISLIQILCSDINTPVACTFDFTGHADGEDVVISNGHGLSNGDKVVLKAGGGALATGFVDYITYYVTDSNTDTFNVSLTSGGADVTISDDGGAAFWYPVESSIQTAVQTNLTKKFISMAAVNVDSHAFQLRAPRITCNQRLHVRALSEAGSTISIGFLLGLHSYVA